MNMIRILMKTIAKHIRPINNSLDCYLVFEFVEKTKETGIYSCPAAYHEHGKSHGQEQDDVSHSLELFVLITNNRVLLGFSQLIGVQHFFQLQRLQCGPQTKDVSRIAR